MECRNFGLKASNDPKKQKKTIENFWSKVDKTPGHGPNGDCWVWTDSKDRCGYGFASLSLIKGTNKAHRISFILTYGDFDRSLYVCHKCDNPHCVNPDHLFLGTQKANMQDRAEKGRGFIPSGSLCGSSVFTDEEVIKLRAVYSSGEYENVQAMARFLGYNGQTLLAMLKGKTYSNLPGACKIKHFQPAQDGDKNPSAKLTRQDVQNIRKLHKEETLLSASDIVKRLNLPCKQHSVRRVIRGESYKESL